MTKRKKQVWGVGDLFAISLLFVNRDLLDSGDWKFFSMASTEFPINKYIKLDELRRDGFINVTSRGSGIIVSLMNAYYSLVPWNSFHDSNYLDSLLISIDKKPNKVVLK